jgi:hypothetical protein
VVVAGRALGGAAVAPVAAQADQEAPRGAVGGFMTPASGTMVLNVRATDVGDGLADARALVDGIVVASTELGGAESVEDLQLSVATPTFGDGAHQLQVVVTDTAGNSAALLDQPFTIANTPPDRQSSALLTLSAGDTTAGGGGSNGGGTNNGGPGTVGGTGGTGSGPVCASPRLSMFLKNKPLRVSKGVPVLRRNGRYRFTGTLTCLSNGRRVRAPAGVVVSLYNQIGKKTYRKNGVTTRSGGALTIILSYPTSRVLDFRYTSPDGTTARVRIRIAVASVAKKKAVR